MLYEPTKAIDESELHSFWENLKNKTAIIACVDENMAIGNKGKLLFHIKEDMVRFKALTTFHTVIMGLNTYKSLPNGALPNRRNIVLSRKTESLPDAEVFTKPIDALIASCNDKVFIIGGGVIYKTFFDFVDTIFLTEVHTKAEEADTYFPPIGDNFYVEKSEYFEETESNPAFSFMQYRRKK